MEAPKIYKCFISSPGDCKGEREACEKVISSVNNGLANHLGINFEQFMLEYDVLPYTGRNGQEIIDYYVEKSDYDIFIGIMKTRFGTPTKKAGSGTEHEYNDAIGRKENSKNGLPRILEMLASKCRAKHIFKNNNPDVGLINRLKKIDSNTKY